MNHNLSTKFFDRARQILPGGVNSPVRSFRSVGGNPFAVKKAEGAYFVDVDGNQYIDLVCSWGALIHGHNHPVIRSAVSEAVADGLSFGITCEREVALAEKIVATYKPAEMIRLVNSGTEACMSAIRLARGFTKRERIIKFDGHYHGHGDSFLVGAGSGVSALPISESAGLTDDSVKNTTVLKFNDVESLEEVFRNQGDKTAAVILEVVSGNMGVVNPDIGFLSELRRLTDKYGTLLIFDEVMTGYRVSSAGAYGLYHIMPDLVCLGKIIGGGMPVGAYGGRRDIMQMVAPLGSVYQAGTLSGNPVSCAAGLASLNLIFENPKFFYQSLDATASEWTSQLESHIQVKNYPVSIARSGSMVTVFFRQQIPQNYSEAQDINREAFKKFFWALLKRGVYYPPSAFEACFLSSAHNESIMNKVASASIEALDEAFSRG